MFEMMTNNLQPRVNRAGYEEIDGQVCRCRRHGFFAISLAVAAGLLLVTGWRQTSADASQDPAVPKLPLLGHSKAIDTVKQMLQKLSQDMPHGKVLFDDTDDGFNAASKTWNACTKPPMAVVLCNSVEDVQIAMPSLAKFRRHHAVPFRIKSGGHSYTGWSGVKDGIILNVAAVGRNAKLDTTTGVVKMGPGVTVQEVLEEVLPKSHGGVVGFCPGVATGFDLGGGVGVQSRLHGLGLDSILEMEVVLADGSLVKVSPHHHPDLYFALRGAGPGNFGVVTQFHLQMHPLEGEKKKTSGQEMLSLDAFIPLDSWPMFMQTLGTMDVPHGFFPISEGGVTQDADGGDAFPVSFLYTGNLTAGQEWLEQELVPLLEQCDYDGEYDLETLSWYNWTVESGNFPGNYASSWSGFLMPEHSTLEAWQEIAQMLVDLCKQIPYLVLDVELWGGAISTKANPNETAFPFRNALFNVGLLALVPVEEENAEATFEELVQTIDKVWSQLYDKYLQGVYLNYQQKSLKKDEYAKAYWDDNLGRSMEIKAKYDPMNVFAHPQSIPLPGTSG